MNACIERIFSLYNSEVSEFTSYTTPGISEDGMKKLNRHCDLLLSIEHLIPQEVLDLKTDEIILFFEKFFCEIFLTPMKNLSLV